MARLTKSEQMARVRTRDTAAEVTLRRALWARGRRYRVHAKLPGRPDVVFPGQRLAVFVDGCFWHGCPEHYTAPATNSPFWRRKLDENAERDRRVDRQLEEQGWRVLRLWEHEVERELDAAVEKVVAALDRPRRG